MYKANEKSISSTHKKGKTRQALLLRTLQHSVLAQALATPGAIPGVMGCRSRPGAAPSALKLSHARPPPRSSRVAASTPASGAACREPSTSHSLLLIRQSAILHVLVYILQRPSNYPSSPVLAMPCTPKIHPISPSSASRIPQRPVPTYAPQTKTTRLARLPRCQTFASPAEQKYLESCL